MLKKKQQYYLSASRNVPQMKPIGKVQYNQSQAGFNIAISKQPIENNTSAVIIEQQRNKLGVYQLCFFKRENIKINANSVYCYIPIMCQQLKEKYIIAEQDFRKFIQQLRTLVKAEQSSDSSAEDPSFSQNLYQYLQIRSEVREIRLKGRPKGSKNRNKMQAENSSQEDFYENQNQKIQKRGRGRPKGAKNKKKAFIDEILHQSNVFQLLSNMISDRSVEEFKLRIRKISLKQEKGVNNMKIEEERDIRRGRGRPKGVRNKPKIRTDEQDSQQSIQIENLQNLQPFNRSQHPICCYICKQRQLKRAYVNRQSVRIEQIKNIAYNIGVQDTTNLVLAAIQQNNQQCLRELLFQKKESQNDFVVCWDTSSRLEQAGYTVRTKKEFISKGKREGINSLIQDCLRVHKSWWKVITVDKILSCMPNSQSSIEIYEIIITDQPQLQKEINFSIPTLVRNGNQYLSAFLIDKVLQSEQNSSIFCFSKQHLECLSRQRGELQFRKSAMLKQNCTQNFCSPIHCASINSNNDLLNYILKHISEFNVGDSLNRKPIHYAALLQNCKNMQILLKYGADLKDIDKRKMTCLMLAAQHGRYKNVKFILDKVRDNQYINFKADDGLSALHYAVVGKHQQCIALLLEDPLIDKLSQTKEGMSILHLAVGTGNQEIVNMIVERGIHADLDYFHRTPLMLAIRNHHNSIFFNLLWQYNGRFHPKDNSFNTLLHYAAAYGNMEIILYLLKVMPQTPNKKNMYPFEIAVLKGHFECAKLLQNWNHHYSQHLLSKLCKQPRGSYQFIRMVNYLLQTDKYDINYKNTGMNGNTCLHFVCSINEKDYYILRSRETSKLLGNQYEQMQDKLISLLLQHGADRSIKNDKDENALHLCIKQQNIVGIELLLQQIPFEIDSQSTNNHFIYYLTKIACRSYEKMQFVLKKLEEVDEKVLSVEIRKTDWQGFEFLIYLIKEFTQSVHHNFWKHYQVYINHNTPKEAILKAFAEYQQHEQALIETVNFLVRIGSDPRTIIEQPKMHKEHQNYKKWGIQHFLMRFPSIKLFKIFMKWIDTNLNMCNSEGRTPLHLFCMWTSQKSLFNSSFYPLMPLINYAEMHDYEGKVCLKYLLNDCCLNSNVIDINRSTPLLYAALNGQLQFVNLLRTFYSPINNVNLLNQVPLIQIIKMKNRFTLEQIESILVGENRARPDFKDINERNVLHHLVSNATNFDTSPEICKKLFMHGVNINSLDKFQRSPIFYCFIKIENQDNNTSYEYSSDKVEILQTLLNHQYINLNIVDIYQRTPLHYACQKDFFFSILYLLDKNINYDIQDAEGNTPLAVCLKHRKLNQAALLIKTKVKYGHVIENGDKYSYFQYVIINKLSVGICFMLIDHGYPLQKALKEVQNQSFKRLLMKRYV